MIAFEFHPDDPKLQAKALLTFILAGTGQVLHDVTAKMEPSTLLYAMDICKSLSWLGAFLVGITAFLKFVTKKKEK